MWNIIVIVITLTRWTAIYDISQGLRHNTELMLTIEFEIENFLAEYVIIRTNRPISRWSQCFYQMLYLRFDRSLHWPFDAGLGKHWYILLNHMKCRRKRSDNKICTLLLGTHWKSYLPAEALYDSTYTGPTQCDTVILPYASIPAFC